MITLKDLKEYDIKNVDIGKIIKTIQQRKDFLANIALVVITLMTVNNITTKERVKTRDLVQKVGTLEKKIQAITSYKAAQKDLTAFLQTFPRGLPEADNIIQKVNSLAIDHGLQISSFTPTGHIESELYNQTNLKLVVTTQKYKDLVLFVKDIESSPYNLRIERWSAKTIQKQPQGRNIKDAKPDNTPPPIHAELELSSIYIQNEK